MPRRLVVDSDDSDSDGEGAVQLGLATSGASGLGVAMLEASSDDEEALFGAHAAPNSATPAMLGPAEEGHGAAALAVESESESESDGSPKADVVFTSHTRPHREASATFRTMFGESAGAAVALSRRPSAAPRDDRTEADAFGLSFDDETEDEGIDSQFASPHYLAASPLPRPSTAPFATAAAAAVSVATVTLGARSGSALPPLVPIAVRGSGEHGTVLGREACAEFPAMILLGGDPEVSSTHARLEAWRRADGSVALTIADLDSSNGTIHKRSSCVGSKLVPGEARLLLSGDTIRIGSRAFRVGVQCAATEAGSVLAAALAALPSAVAAAYAAEGETSSEEDEEESESAEDYSSGVEDELALEEADGGAWVLSSDDDDALDGDDADDADVEERRAAKLTRLDVIRLQQQERRALTLARAGERGSLEAESSAALDGGAEGALAVLRSAAATEQHAWRYVASSGDRVLCGFATDVAQAQAAAAHSAGSAGAPRPFVLAHGVHDRLMQHQLDGVAWMYRLQHQRREAPTHADGVTLLPGGVGGVDATGRATSGGLLCDDMGLGKTVQIAAFLGALFGSAESSRRPTRVLIAVPKVVFEQVRLVCILWR